MYMLNFKCFVVLVFFSFSCSFCNALKDDEQRNSVPVSSRTHRTEGLDRQPSWSYFSIAKTILLTGGSLCLAGYFFYKKQSTPAKIFASLGGLSFLHDLFSNFSLSHAKDPRTQPSLTDDMQSHCISSAGNSSEVDLQMIPFGKMQLVIPADVAIETDERGNQVITLPAVCYMIVFDEIRKAIRENTTVKRLHESKRNQILERDDLDTKFGITFGDMRAAADQGGGSAEPIIRTLGDFIDEITKGTDGAIPDDIIIKWERHKTSFAGRILLVKDGKGLFISTNPTVKSDQ